MGGASPADAASASPRAAATPDHSSDHQSRIWSRCDNTTGGRPDHQSDNPADSRTPLFRTGRRRSRSPPVSARGRGPDIPSAAPAPVPDEEKRKGRAWSCGVRGGDRGGISAGAPAGHPRRRPPGGGGRRRAAWRSDHRGAEVRPMVAEFARDCVRTISGYDRPARRRMHGGWRRRPNGRRAGSRSSSADRSPTPDGPYGRLRTARQ